MGGAAAGGAMKGAGDSLANPDRSRETRTNDLYDQLNYYLQTNPFENAKATANLDLAKWRNERKGINALMSPEVLNKLGSSAMDDGGQILGVNADPLEVAMAAKEEYEKEGAGFLRKMLGGALTEMGNSTAKGPGGGMPGMGG
jgi:hypothetical protein